MKVVVISDGYAEGQAIVPIYRVDLEGHLDHGDERENEERDTEINLSLAPKVINPRIPRLQSNPNNL